MSVRSQRNMLDKLGIDSRGEPWWFREGRRSRVTWTRGFVEMRRHYGHRNMNVTPLYGVTFTRNSVATIKDSAGALITRPAHRERYFTNFGVERTMLLCEGARTNFLLNSGVPVTQTTGSLSTGDYALWLDGPGTATVTAGTATITNGGAATAAAPRIFQVTVAGTVTVTISGGTPTRFQLENGGVPTSYIATTGATATRARDELVWTPVAAPGGSGLFASPGTGGQGTIVGKFMLPQVNQISPETLLSFDAGNDNNRIHIIQPNSTLTLHLRVVNGGTQTVDLLAGVNIVAGKFYRYAIAWNGNNYAFCITGGAVVTATAASSPSGLVNLRLGHAIAAGAAANGYVGLVGRFPRRLSDAALRDAVYNA